MFKVKEIKHIDKIAEKGLRASYVIEKRTGMPQKYKVPSVKIKWVRL